MVNSATHEPIGRALVYTADERSNTGPLAFTRLLSGALEIYGVLAGKYTIRTRTVPGSGVSGGIADFDISQDGQELDPPAGESVSNAKLSVSVVGAARLPQRLVLALRTKEQKIVRRAPVDAHGSAELIYIPPGKYDLLDATPANDYAVTRIVVNGTQTKGHILEVAAGTTIEGTVTIIGVQTVVRGVAKRDGKAVPGAMIAPGSKRS